MENTTLSKRVEDQKEVISNMDSLLEVARNERDSFRDSHEKAQAALDDAKHDHASELASLQAKISDLNKENEGLHYKLIGLEDDHKRVQEDLNKHRATIEAMRGMLN